MNVAVYGASGRTGGFVVAELLRRGHVPIAIARDAAKLGAFDGRAVDRRAASLDDPSALARSLVGAEVVIHCAGPFLDTAEPLIEASLAAGIHYIDVTAEQECARSTFASFDAAARKRGVVILPGAGFFGGLGDLLATAAMADWTQADRIEIAIALDGWQPTLGTRKTGARNSAPRVILADGVLTQLPPSSPKPWSFPLGFGTEDVVEVPLTETILIAKHVNVREIHNYINQTPLRDLSDSTTPSPVATDDSGRSSQVFYIEAVARNGSHERRASAHGRDIYATTAPIVVEAAERLVTGDFQRGGAFALAERFDALRFLQALTTRDASFHVSAAAL